MKHYNSLFVIALSFFVAVKCQSLSFEDREPMLLGRAHMASVVHENNVYLIGGFLPDDNYLGSVEMQLFNASTQQWTTLANHSRPFYGGCAVLYEDAIYVFGGYDGDIDRSDQLNIYNIANSSWTQGQPMPFANWEHSCVLNPESNNIHIINGNTNNGYNDRHLVYSIASGNYSDDVPPTTSSWGQRATFYNSMLYVFGGESSNSVRRLEPTGNWTEMTSMPATRAMFGGLNDGTNYWVLGGTDQGDEGADGLNNIWSYSFSTDEWTEHVDNLTIGLNGPSIHIVGASVRIFGGLVNDYNASTTHLFSGCIFSCPDASGCDLNECNASSGLCQLQKNECPTTQVPQSQTVPQAPATQPTAATSSVTKLLINVSYLFSLLLLMI
jgi:hypothetical protein